MKRILIIISLVFVLSSCGSTANLYYWGGTTNETTRYEDLAYKSYDKQTPESICRLIAVYEDMVTNTSGTRQMPPPGICAEYGYLLLKPETAEMFAKAATQQQRRLFGSSDYNVAFKQRGKELLKMEIALYPEAAKFLAPLVKRLAD